MNDQTKEWMDKMRAKLSPPIRAKFDALAADHGPEGERWQMEIVNAAHARGFV